MAEHAGALLGTARPVDGDARRAGAAFSGLADAERQAYIEGTPCYMSPEQVRGEALDERTDVYSLALILYECLAGRPAFAHDADVKTVLHREIPPLQEAPEGVARVLLTAMQKSRDDRWATARAFHAALAKAAQPEACQP